MVGFVFFLTNFFFPPSALSLYIFHRGTYQNKSGQPSCNKCPKNTKSEQANSTTCDSCGKGSKSDEGSARCSTCDAGEAGTPCAACIPGLYRQSKNDDGTATDGAACVACPAGYSSGEGSTKCQTCEAGKFSDTIGAGDCKQCLKGYYREADSTELTSCIQCIKGETSKEGASSCDGCDVGKYGSTAGTCSPCPSGQYQDGKGESSCKECDVDTYLNEQGKSSKADCHACSNERSTGTVQGATQASACLCQRALFYHDAIEDTCIACPTGADCARTDGIVLNELVAVNGYW